MHRHRIMRGGVMHERIAVHNYGRETVQLRVSLRFRALFLDLFIIKGFISNPRGHLLPPEVPRSDRVELGYDGRDGVKRTTAISFRPPPTDLDGRQAWWRLTLAPGECRILAVAITPSAHDSPSQQRRPGTPHIEPGAMRRWLTHQQRIWEEQTTSVRSSNELFDRTFARALLDMRLLRSKLDGLQYFAAGIPWFVTLFGRDAATVAIQTNPYGQHVSAATLRLLARHQATNLDPYRDAEPGKILHEYRAGELAQDGAIPQSPAYYGTVDATLLFLILMAEYVNWSGDLDLPRSLRPAIDAALRWIEEFGDHDGDGYLDYDGRYQNGLINQGWKDSGNAIINADGSLAEPPIALCEVQAYLFRAWRQAAALLRTLGDAARADELDHRADELRVRFERDFWRDDLGCYMLARQREGRPAAVVSSNAGQVLWGGIASPERAARVAERLTAPDMFSGWGVRTLSADATGYNPVGYHLGSVWPHDNALIAAGLRRYGHDTAAVRIFGALFEATAHFRDQRMPELFCGFAQGEGDGPVRYPVACSPQAWAAGALPHLLWNLLGLRADATRGHIRC